MNFIKTTVGLLGLLSYANATNEFDLEAVAEPTFLNDYPELLGFAPGTVFDLTPFKLQVPYSSTGSFTSGSPIEIKQPELNSYEKANLFFGGTDSAGGHYMVLKTPCKGLTTSNSEHPRVELRANAEWNGASSTKHTISATYTVHKVAAVSKRTTIMQIFDGDLGHAFVEFFAESGKGLYFYVFERDHSHTTYMIDSNWAVGQKFNLKSSIQNGNLQVLYHNSLTQSITTSNIQGRTGLYFKAGDYC